MACTLRPCLLLLLLLLLAAAAAPASAGGASSALPWIPVGSTIGDGEEFDLGSEVSRRILATTHYIGYGALKRDTVPCSWRGASYYNCLPGAHGNPYSRGCSAITRCRGG